ERAVLHSSAEPPAVISTHLTNMTPMTYLTISLKNCKNKALPLADFGDYLCNKIFLLMKKVLAILGILIVLFVAYVWFFYFSGRKNHNSGPKPVPIAVSKHTEVFNSSIDNVLNAYYGMTEGFVNWDTNSVHRYGA